MEDNILDWRFVMKGAADGPYAGGVYMGRLKFPPEYPWKPPSVLMCTPSGRFETGTRICLSIRYVRKAARLIVCVEPLVPDM